MKLNTRQITLISVFAALQAIISRVPGIPIIGVEGGNIEPTILLMPVIGIVLGPWIGGLAAFIGNLIAWLIPSTSFYGMLLLPTGPVGAIVSGALARTHGKSNWKTAALVLGALIILWYISPAGFLVPYYPILHLSALILVLAFRQKTAQFIRSGGKRELTWGTIISSFCGIMANHMTGTLIFIGSVQWFLELKGIKNAIVNLGFNWLKSGLPNIDPTGLGTIFVLVFPITIAERLIMTAIAVFIGVGILYTLRKSGIISL